MFITALTTFIFTSLSALYIFDFHIFAVVNITIIIIFTFPTLPVDVVRLNCIGLYSLGTYRRQNVRRGNNKILFLQLNNQSNIEKSAEIVTFLLFKRECNTWVLVDTELSNSTP